MVYTFFWRKISVLYFVVSDGNISFLTLPWSLCCIVICTDSCTVLLIILSHILKYSKQVLCAHLSSFLYLAGNCIIFAQSESYKGESHATHLAAQWRHKLTIWLVGVCTYIDVVPRINWILYIKWIIRWVNWAYCSMVYDDCAYVPLIIACVIS